MHQFPHLPSSEEPVPEDPRVPLPSPTLPFTLGSGANHFTDLWKARAEGICREPHYLMRVETQAGRVTYPISLTHRRPYAFTSLASVCLAAKESAVNPVLPTRGRRLGPAGVCGRAHYPMAPDAVKRELAFASPGGL